MWITTASTKLSADTIKKCFSKGELSGNNGDDQDFIEQDTIPLAKLFSVFTDIKRYASINAQILTESPETFTIENCIRNMAEDFNFESNSVLKVEIMKTLNVIYYNSLKFVQN